MTDPFDKFCEFMDLFISNVEDDLIRDAMEAAMSRTMGAHILVARERYYEARERDDAREMQERDEAERANDE